MKKLKPLNDQVVSKPYEEVKERYGNIIIPDSGDDKAIFAEVVAISSGIFNYHTGGWIDHQVKVGDIILLPKMGVQKTTIENQEYYICQANQLLAILEDETEA